MSRTAALLAVVTTTLSASSVGAAESAPDLEQKPLVWIQAFTAVQTVFEAPPPSTPDREGSIRPGADLGLRVAVGQGKWSADPRVLPGYSGANGNLDRGYAVGLWAKYSAASPALPEHSAATFGVSASGFRKTSRDLMLVNTVEVGGRFSVDDQGRTTTESPASPGQVHLGISQQVALFDSFLVGPALSVDIGNKAAPSAMATGLRMSSVF